MGSVPVVHPKGKGILKPIWIQTGDYGNWKSVPAYEAEDIRYINRTIEIALSRGFHGKAHRWEGYPADVRRSQKRVTRMYSVTELVNRYWDKLSPQVRQKYIFAKIGAKGYRKLKDREYNFISRNWSYLNKSQHRLVTREVGRWKVEGVAKTHAIKQIMKRAEIEKREVKPIKKPKPIIERKKKAAIRAKVPAKYKAKVPLKQPVPKPPTKQPTKKPVIHPKPRTHSLIRK